MLRRSWVIASSFLVLSGMAIAWSPNSFAGKGGRSSSSRSSHSSHSSTSHSSSSHSYSSSSSHKSSSPTSHTTSSPSHSSSAPSHTSSSNTSHTSSASKTSAPKYSSSSSKSAVHADPSHHVASPVSGASGNTNRTIPPKASAPTVTKTNKYSSSSSAVHDPSQPAVSHASTSSKPISNGMSSKARANQQAASQRKFAETQKAVSPAKPSYLDPAGKTVNVRTNSPVVQQIRNQPSTLYTPQQRNQRYTTVINNYNYGHPYSFYYGQPFFHVGGGFSSAFWWMMMMEWSAERRAAWLYHNESHIERDAYERGMKDAAVAEELAKLKAAKTPVNPDYVDKDFVDNPDLQYTQEHIDSVYPQKPVEEAVAERVSSEPAVADHGPALAAQHKGSSWSSLLMFLAVPASVVGLYFLFFKMRVTG